MNVLLLCSIPNQGRHPQYHKTTDVDAIRNAIVALCEVISAADGVLVYPEDPEITALISPILQQRQFRVENEPLIQEVLENIDFAVLIGGMGYELSIARRARAAGTKVWPIGSTGWAARTLLAESVGFHPTTKASLQSTAYGPLFQAFLSL